MNRILIIVAAVLCTLASPNLFKLVSVENMELRSVLDSGALMRFS